MKALIKSFKQKFYKTYIKTNVKNFSVRKKVLIPPIVSIFFIISLGIIFLVGIIRQQVFIDDIFDKRFQIYKQSSEIVKIVNVIQTNMYKGIVWAKVGYESKNVNDLLDQQLPMLKQVSDLIKMVLSSDVLEKNERKTFEDISKNFEQYKSLVQVAKESAVEVKDLTTASVALQMADVQFGILFDNLNELMKIQNELSKESHQKSKDSFTEFTVFFILFVIIALLISIFISIFITSFIVDPIKYIIKVLRESPSGDVDIMKLLKINSRDEIGNFAEFFSNYITEIKDTKEILVKTNKALWGEMQLAKKIQTVLLPDSPTIKNYEISANMLPADEVGGDYYDVINVSGKDWIVIGDVSGHGVPAGLIMMMVQTSINLVLNYKPDIQPSELLKLINKTLYKNIMNLNDDKYMTITVLAQYENGKFYFSGLHQDIIIYRSISSSIEIVETTGMWLGLLEDVEGMMDDNVLYLNPGDCFLLYTDGVTEAFDKEGNMFSSTKLIKILNEHGAKTTEEIKASVLKALQDYQCNDDVTLVVVKRLR